MILRKNKEFELNEKNIIKAIWHIFIPVLIANMLQTAYNITDTFWVGKLGAKAVASVSISYPLLFLLISIISGFALAGSILVAQYKGKRDQRMINYISAQTVFFALSSAIVIGIIGYIITPSIIKLFTSDKTTIDYAIGYLRIIFLGSVFIFGFRVIQSLLRSINCPRIPTAIFFISVLLNFILDPLFINGYGFIPALKVEGAALATLITQLIAFILVLIVIQKKDIPIKIKLKDLKPDFKIMLKLMKIGYPASLEQIIRSIGSTLMLFIVSKFGTKVIASFGIGMRVFGFLTMPTFAFFVTTSTLVGQSLGADNKRLAIKITNTILVISFIMLTTEGLLAFLFSKQIVSIFINDDSVIEITVLFVKLISFSLGFIAMQLVIEGAASGSGNTKLAMLFAVISLLIIRIPLAYYLSLKLNYLGIWLAYPIETISLTIVYLIVYFKRRDVWFSNKISEEIFLESKTIEEVEIYDEE